MLPFGGRPEPARPASLHRGPSQRPDEPACQLTGPRPPQLSLLGHALARRGQARTLCLASGPSWLSCREDDEKPLHSPSPDYIQPRPPRRATASKTNALFGVVDETIPLPFCGRPEPARPASLLRGPSQRPDEPAYQLPGRARYNFRRQVTPRPDAARAEYETTSPCHRPPAGNLPGARS